MEHPTRLRLDLGDHGFGDDPDRDGLASGLDTNEHNELVEWPEQFRARSRREEGAGRAPQLTSNEEIARKGPALPSQSRSAVQKAIKQSPFYQFIL
jgi:hypothetical protein